MHKPTGLERKVEMAPYTTMQLGGEADYFVTATSVADVAAAAEWAHHENIPVFALGEGSNIIVKDGALHRLVIKIEIQGYEVIEEDDTSVTIEIGAGMHWDDAVARSVKEGLAGIEAMSMIPGTVGATPVQNAGAYGQEIADTLVSVSAYDTRDHEQVTLEKDDCGFGYRDSAFKRELAGRYIITSVTVKLSKGAPAAPTYSSLKRYLEEQEISHPDVAQIRSAVMHIRAKILPDPTVIPNTGSFFKNPIVEPHVLNRLRLRYPEIPAFEHGDLYKLSAGWLLDECGFKGAEHFGLRLHDRHALVITNPNHAGYANLMKLVDLMTEKVRNKFEVTLEPEPQFID